MENSKINASEDDILDALESNDVWDYPDPRCPKAPKPFNKFYAT